MEKKALLTAIAVVTIAVIVAISVVFMPHASGANVSTGEQENTTITPLVATTVVTTAVDNIVCVPEEPKYTTLYWSTLWNLDKNQVTQLDFFDGCEYRGKLPAWRFADYEKIVDARIMAYTKDQKQEAIIKNWSFRKVIYLDSSVKIINNTEINPTRDVTPYLFKVDNPMEEGNKKIFLYYFHDNTNGGIIAVGWGDETTGVLKKFDTSGGGDGFSGGSSSTGGDSGSAMDDDSGEHTGGDSVNDDSGDFPSGPTDTSS
ncbi:MAG TPA: hypothetical protein PLD14_03305 [Candidatus Pacearchaeota archaeon]|nr:hypothetical protein [Candidatus Pacearchaeota archaeon]HPR80225.1 hypothetical protein [Candidatus Pacearchaeota archaeon]